MLCIHPCLLLCENFEKNSQSILVSGVCYFAKNFEKNSQSILVSGVCYFAKILKKFAKYIGQWRLSVCLFVCLSVCLSSSTHSSAPIKFIISQLLELVCRTEQHKFCQNRSKVKVKVTPNMKTTLCIITSVRIVVETRDWCQKVSN